MDEGDHTSILLRNLGFNQSNAHVNRLVDQLRDSDPNNVLVALESLSSTLLMSPGDTLLTFPTSEALGELVQILENPTPYPEIPVLAARVITQLIDRGVPDVLEQLVENGILDALYTRFQDIAYVDIVEQAIVILERVAHEYPGQVLTSGCPVLCLQYIDFFNMHIQKSILTVVAICCSAISAENIDSVRLIVPILEEHLTGCGQSLIDLSITGMCLLIQAVAKKVNDPRAEIRSLFNENIATIISLRVAPQDPLLSKALKALDHLVINIPQLVPEFIKSHLPLAIAHALTTVPNITKTDTYDPNDVIPALLHCNIDALNAAMHLLGAFLATPKLVRPYVGPYQKDEGTDKSLLADVPMDAIEESAATTIQLASFVHSFSADLVVRQQALLNVLKVANCLPKKIIKTVAKQLDIVSFVCMVVSQADTLVLTIGGLEICTELITKLPEVFMSPFIGQGLASELDAIIETCPEPEGKIPEKWSFSSQGLEPVASYIAKLIKENIKNELSDAPSTSPEALIRLKNGDKSAWPDVACIIHERSMFELLRLGAFDIIADAIIEDSAPFLNAFSTEQFRELVLKLEEAFSRTERCGVLSTTNGPIVSLVGALNRHIRIRLKDNNLKTSWSLNVQGIASIKNLEEFCQNKLALFQFVGDDNLFAALNGHRRANSHDDEGEDDDDEDEEDEGEEGEEDGHSSSDYSDDDASHNLGDEVTDSEQEMQEVARADETEFDDLQSSMSDEGPDEDFDMDLQDQIRVQEQTVDEEDGAVEDELEEQENGSNSEEDLVEVTTRDNDNDILNEMSLASALGRLRGRVANAKPPALKFSYNGKPLYSDMSVLGAIYNRESSMDGDTIIPRSIWSDEFTICFERTEKPVTTSGAIASDSVDTCKEVPKSLGENPQLKSSIRLLNLLHVLNEKRGIIQGSDFINMKLTSKLNRQLDDPLIVIANILPQWVIDTVRIYPFLFPFESRYLFVKSTSFGYSRSMSRWQSQNEDEHLQAPRMSMGRAVKQKYRISRKGLLANALKVLSMTSRMAAMVEIEYYGEQGTGLGPTLEFYSTVSKEFQRESTKMWRGESIEGYMFDPRGLFPAPMEKRSKTILNLFTGLGRFFARALLDERLMDLRINPAFFILVLRHEFFEQEDILRLVDPGFADQLFALEKSSVEELELDFTLPSYDEIELLPGGRDQLVTGARLQEYRDLVLEWTVGKGVARQIEGFRDGFSECMSIDALNAFLPVDFGSICGQNNERWDEATLKSVIKADHGYTLESKPIVQLIELMSKFEPEERRRFLQFMTGSPNLPIGGFKRLDPAFTIVLKQSDDSGLSPDDYFPSVMTCANYLKLPAYSSKDIMAKRLWEAIEGGSGVFPLS